MIEPSLKTLLSLLLVDDHTVVREGLKRLIEIAARGAGALPCQRCSAKRAIRSLSDRRRRAAGLD